MTQEIPECLRSLKDVDIYNTIEGKRLGFSHNDMCIHDPRLSECGRFEVDYTYYGLTAEQADAMVKFNSILEVS